MSQLSTNTTSLQEILEVVNNLPNADSGNIELPKLSNPAIISEIFLNKEAISRDGRTCGFMTTNNT